MKSEEGHIEVREGQIERRGGANRNEGRGRSE